MQKDTLVASPVELPVNLHRVAQYIQDHYGEDLGLEKLASVACYSKYHFHRVFREHFGETVSDHIRRVRLEQAARLLALNASVSVAEVAAACGFSNAQNFARVFKDHFDCSPTAFRKKPDEKYLSMMDASSMQTDGREPLQVTMQELSPCRVLYIRTIGPYAPEVYDQTFNRLLQWVFERGVIKDFYIPIGAGSGDFRKSPEQAYVYDACLAVPEEVEGEGEVCTQTLAGGRYAVMHCEDTLEAIELDIARLLDEWLPASGYMRDERPVLTFYSNNRNGNPRKIAVVDICLPIKS